MSFKVILWPTDASASSLKALQAAVEMAELHEAVLHGLQVINQVPQLAQSDTGFVPSGTVPFNVPLYEKELSEAAKKEMEKTIAEKIQRGPKATKEHRRGEDGWLLSLF